MPFDFISFLGALLGLFPWLFVVGTFVLGGRQKAYGGWSSLVVQEWRANNEPDEAGRFIYIRGRKAGLVSWLLSTLSLDATVSVAALEGRIEFEQSSLSGKRRTMIPLSSISSTEYGYHKPWRGAVILFAISATGVTFLLNLISTRSENLTASVIAGWLAGLIVAALYYIFNRKLRLGFREHSNQLNGLEFQRSFIEGREISEDQAGYVCLLIQTLIENDRARATA